MRDVDKANAVEIVKGVVACHPIGIVCNILSVWVVLASVGVALFKGKVLSALLVIALCFLIRFVVLRILGVYISRKITHG